MRMSLLTIASLVVGILSQGCGVSGPWSVREPRFGLRKDIFQGVPAWESKFFTSEPQATSKVAPLALKDIEALSKISKYTSPGLFVMLRQVDSGSPLLASESDDTKIVALLRAKVEKKDTLSIYGTRSPGSGLFAVDTHMARNAFFADTNDAPFPKKLLKDQPLTAAYVKSLATARYNGNMKILAAQNDLEPSVYKIEEETFTVQNFRRFGEAFLEVNLDILRTDLSAPDFTVNGESKLEERKTRLARIEQMSVAPANSFTISSNKLPITWDGLAFQYFIAYYKGKFVDRVGGKLAKPELGKKISNETITAAVTVGLESIYDFAVLTASLGPADEAIRAPIVYSGAAKNEKFETANNNKPTLVVVTQKLLKIKKNEAIKPWPFVLEPLVADPANIGLTKAKLKVVRFVSGIAGDGAGGLSDLIVRSFGGIHIGFVLLGKVSVGDDETLAKLVETVIGSLASRASELFASDVLYGVTFPAGEAPDWHKDSPAVLLLKYLTHTDGDSEDGDGDVGNQEQS